MIARRLRLPAEAYLDETERGASLRELLRDEWREFTDRMHGAAPVLIDSTTPAPANSPRAA